MSLENRPLLARIYRFLAAGLLFLLPAPARGQTVTATVATVGAQYVGINQTTNKIYAGSTVIDGATNATTPLTVSGSGTVVNQFAVALNPATNKIYVVNFGNYKPLEGTGNQGSIGVVDGDTNSEILIRDPNAIGPHAIAVNPVTNKIYVANFWTDNITVIDGATNVLTTLANPDAFFPTAVAVNSETNKIYVANLGNFYYGFGSNTGNVSVIEGATNSITTVTDPNAISPSSVAVNPVTDKIYVANQGTLPCATGNNLGNITVIDGATDSTTTVTDPNACAPAGADSRGFAVAVNSATDKIYVANARSGNVTVINGATNSTSTVTDPNAFNPSAVAVDEATNMIYIANEGCSDKQSGCFEPGSVTVIDGATNSAMTVVDPNANAPFAVAVNPTTDEIYVGNLLSNNVTVIAGGASPATHTLFVTLAGSGSGTVTSNPAGINCGTSCAASFATGTAVNLTASPASGSTFSGWSGPCSGTSTCSITMTSSEFVTSTFNAGPPSDFSVTPASTNLTTQRGGQVTDAITIAPLNGTFGSSVQVSCTVTGSTPIATCGLSPTSVTPGANSATSTLTITAPGLAAQLKPFSEGQLSSRAYAAFLPLPGLALIGLGLARRNSKNRRGRLWFLCSLFIAFVALQAGCGGGSQPPPPLNYSVTITATSGVITHTTKVTLSVQ
jgi:DNA-binding beta-propeller fold protein YncE